MNAFFQDNVQEGTNQLPEEEARHCVQVLRHQVGDEILVLDGKGGQYHSIITSISKRSCLYQVTSAEQAPEKPFRIHLAIAPTKNIERMEWLVEKLTEMAVDEISLLQTKNSERRKIRIDRLKKKVLSALKQSKNPFLPKVNELTPIEKFLIHKRSGKKLIAHVSPDHVYIGDSIVTKEEVLILIGPEGDFTTNEVNLAIENGFQPISLGASTLRTETAGLVACCAVNLLNKR